MNANERKLQDVLSGSSQFVIPLFQRHYSWRHAHWIRLLNDIRRLHSPTSLNQQHFMGSLVCMADAPMPGMVTGYQIIDGQQRLTTISLLLAAIRDVAKAKGYHGLGEEITETYLIHRHRKGLERFKLLSRIGDREAMISIAEGNPDPKHFQHTGVDEAWRFFKRQVGLLINDGSEQEIRALLATIVSRLSLVFILVSGEDPYEIFESLNTTGLPLSQADLIRNFVFMQVSMGEQEDFDRVHWKPLEDEIKAIQQNEEDLLTPFFRDYLMVRGRFIDAQAVFSEFKTFYATSKLQPAALVADLKKYLPCFLWLHKPEMCPDARLRVDLEEFASSDIGTGNPLILSLYRQWQEGRITPETFRDCIRDLVSFALRRSICGEGTGAYARWFVEAITEIRTDVQHDVRTYLQRRGWPDDAIFVERLQRFPIYRRESLKARMVLLGLERNFQHKEEVNPEPLTLEHVMPQTITNNANGKAWKVMLGSTWEEDHEALLDVLGNLTLTGYNSSLGNQPYPEKRSKYAESHVELNKYFADHEQWNASAIDARGLSLARSVASIWPRTVSGVYAPPVGVDTSSLREGKRMRYWNEFRAVLGERMPDLQALTIYNRSLTLQSAAADAFGLSIYIHPKTGYLQVGLDAGFDSDAVAQAIIAHLAAAKDDWNARLGFPALWLDPSTGQLVCDIDSEGDATEESDWPVQHAWFIPRLTGFTQVLLPELDRILTEPETLQPLLAHLKDSQVASFLYWQGFRKALQAAGHGKLRPGASTSRFFRQIVPSNYVELSAEYGADWCSIYLLTRREDVAQQYTQIITNPVFAEVLATLGATLDQQILPGGKSWLCLWIPCDSDDISDRPRQYEWMTRAVSIAQERILPLIESAN